MKNLKFSPPFLRFLTLLILGLHLSTFNCLAWEGIDQEKNSLVEIPPGVLVREGLIIDFYDDEDLHTARVITVNSVAGGTELVVEDLNEEGKERTLIMRE